MRVGLIGFGFAGRTFHAPVISAVPGLELALILQRSGADAVKWYPTAKVVRTLPDLLAEDLGFVVIATPNSTHFALARECLLAGHSVVVDKPFTVTTAEARELMKLADDRRLILSVYQNRRWDGDFLLVKQTIASGRLGRVVRFEARFDRFRPELQVGAWRESAEPGSGILYDLGPHLIDQALQLFGDPESVCADVRKERDGAITDDAFDLRMEYPGLTVDLGASMIVAAPGPRFAVHGTNGSLLTFGMDPQEDALKQGKVPGNKDWPARSEQQWGELYEKATGELRKTRIGVPTGDYREFYVRMRDSVASRVPPAVTAEQALRVIEVIQAPLTSRSEQKR